VTVDLGTGDGRFVLATAAANPGRLVIGVDPVASAMAESSRRAARPAHRGGIPNALFVVAAAESLPVELHGIADRVTINLPWGSLLRGALALDDAAAAGIAALPRVGGVVELLVAPADRDGLAEDIDVRSRLDGGLAADWRAHGLTLERAREATATELGAIRTTWARRLGLGAAGDRRAWRLVLQREGQADPSSPVIRSTGASRRDRAERAGSADR
jgi:16S rRNA (adenine(1408)-N(1))-methyltransferase